MYKQILKNIEDILSKDPGCKYEIDCLEQTSWLLFLKYTHDIEKERKEKANLTGAEYKNIIDQKYSWEEWAAPKTEDGKIDNDKALSGDEIKDFVNLELFPYLMNFRIAASTPGSLEYIIGEIFSEIRNKIESPYNLREVINLTDQLDFKNNTQSPEFRNLYEDKMNTMSTPDCFFAGYFTPRPLIKTILKVIAPKLGETIYDGALGSAGFFCEAYEYLININGNLTDSQKNILQTKTFYGKEKRIIPFLTGTMNMLLHGIESPNVKLTNTLRENLAEKKVKDRYDIILSDLRYAGMDSSEVQQSFPIKTRESVYLFLQHFIQVLKPRGRACVLVNSVFFDSLDSDSIAIRKLLTDSCDLHTVLILQDNIYALFFEKGIPTKKMWYYELNHGRYIGLERPFDKTRFVELLLKLCRNINNESDFNKSHFLKLLLDLNRRIKPESQFKKDDFTELMMYIEKNIDNETPFSKKDYEELQLTLEITTDNYGLLDDYDFQELRYNLQRSITKDSNFNENDCKDLLTAFDRSIEDIVPLNEKDFARFLRLRWEMKRSKRSWTVSMSDVNPVIYNLKVRIFHRGSGFNFKRYDDDDFSSEFKEEWLDYIDSPDEFEEFLENSPYGRLWEEIRDKSKDDFMDDYKNEQDDEDGDNDNNDDDEENDDE